MRPLALILLAAALAGCSVGPDYRPPSLDVPARFREWFGAAQVVSPPPPHPAAEGWALATPRDAAERGAWWAIYGDPVLDGLERQVEINNQTLKASEAAYRQAAAVVRAARASYFPTLTLSPAVQRTGSGGGGTGSSSGGNSGAGTTGAASRGFVVTEYSLDTVASWNIDVWGRIRRTVEGDVANAQASAGDVASARLSAQASVAADYFQLRVADELQRLLYAAAAAYAESLRISQNQYKVGVAARSDVAQAETQLKTTQAQAINAGILRAQTEHAIAVLIGKAPAEFSIAPAPMSLSAPVMPPGVPSTLLQRRPDIAVAERRVAFANAQIGVATAAYFPDLTLNASLDYSNIALGGLLRAANQVWSVGPQLSQNLFEGGLTVAQVDEARAIWEQNTATYRQTVLTSFQQVEDQLAALRILAQQAEMQAQAVAAAKEAERLVLNQYKAGTVAYTSVVVAQTAALSNEQAELTVLESRLAASVALIQALGGGWERGDLPADPTGDEFGKARQP
jgi:NodT family efflux transporter outer membrane factor (OMF) lipoprotein